MVLQMKEFLMCDLLKACFAVINVVQGAAGNDKSLQVRFVRAMRFFELALCRPRPPSSLGLVSILLFTKWSFFLLMVDPQIKSL